MNTSLTATRRDFLRTALGTSAVLSLGTAAPAFLLEAAAQAPASTEETILVVIELTGGNDGLNTVAPYADDAYRKARPKLGLSADQVLKIDDYAGFHPSLRGCADLLEAGQLAIVQGVGYPNPNRSHFESMDIWHTCHTKTQSRTDGWLGRYLDATLREAGRDVPAIHLGAEKQPLALTAQHVRVPSIQSLERFRLAGDNREQLQEAVRQLTHERRVQSDGLLDFVQTSTSAALTASERVEAAVKEYKTDLEYPDTGLAQKLRTIAQLIDAGMGTRVYYVSLENFDTHSEQAEAHAALLRQWSDALSVFIQDLVQHDHGQRVLVLSFSEFGRRLAENASEGTDHGAAAPVFLTGPRVRAGLHGKNPNLTDLDDGDPRHHTDFRQVYATLLSDWLKWPSSPILGTEYQPLNLIAS